MIKITGNLLPAGLAISLFALAGPTSPAFSKCIQEHPIFGIDVYVEDKYCPKKPVKAKVVKKKSPAIANRSASRPATRLTAKPVMTAKPEKRIMEMQTMLTSLGYNPGPIDGYDGPMTRKAAGEFNVANDLPAKASVGSTNAVLKYQLAPKPDMRVMKMQGMLSSMGYDTGAVDGFPSPATKKAAGDFNIANDLPRKASISSTIAVLSGLMGN